MSNGLPKPKIGGFAVPKIVNYQSLPLNKTYVLVHSITRGLAVPKTVIKQSLSLNPGLNSNQNFINLNELFSFIFNSCCLDSRQNAVFFSKK